MNTNVKDLDIIVPITIDLDWPTVDGLVSDILEQRENYGLTKFMLSCPGGGWRSGGYPTKEKIIELANMFVEIRNKLKNTNIELGWWISITIKSGPNNDFSGAIKSDGSKHPFGNCPLDKNYKKRFSEDVALFAKIADPCFIILEDDYSLTSLDGCYCENHLNEFAKRQGKFFPREEIVNILRQGKPQDFEFIRAWRELLKDSLVELAASIRKELDKCSPHIPAGIMQSGSSDVDGDTVLPIAKALAGEKHTPFARLCGAFYNTFSTKDIPDLMFHSLYNKQHIKEDFIFYHETDTYPHTRFFVAASHVNTMMAMAYSQGFDGSTFQTQQLLDCPNEEAVYGKLWKKEKLRFNKLHKIVNQCELKGVQLKYDPFFSTVNEFAGRTCLLWLKILSRFGIPYVTTESDVAFWNVNHAKYATTSEILSALSKTLFLDGDAAKELCDRGFAKYLGVEVGGNVLDGNTILYDLGAREVICDKFARKAQGKNMPSAHMYNPLGNGKMLTLTKTDKKCETITEFYDFKKQFISTSMTRFENELGGKVIVMGLTLDYNKSHALYNYRRKRIFEDMLHWADCDFAFVKESPEVFLIENRAIDAATAGFKACFTLTNYCEDTLETVEIRLPSSLKNISRAWTIEQNGELREINFETTNDGIKLNEKLMHLTPVYVIVD